MPLARHGIPVAIVLILIVAVILGGPTHPQPVVAGGILVYVDTTADEDGTNSAACSLREAIKATNVNGNYGGCLAAGGGFDGIEFALGLNPVINIGSTLLPTITDAVSLNGSTGTSRVELRGPGGGPMASHNGLLIGSTAPGTQILNMAINGFDNAIRVEAANVVIKGNFLGTDATGTNPSGNVYSGIYVLGNGVQIGGTTGTTAGGPCTGDCNLVAANGTTGISLSPTAGNAVIAGNFIGTNAAGTESGMFLNYYNAIDTQAQNTLVGGTAAGAGNLIVANEPIPGAGSSVRFYNVTSGTVQGNLVGTNAAGMATLPHTGGDIQAEFSSNILIGGTTPTARNVLAGGGTANIILTASTNITVQGNYIGTAIDGTTPLSGHAGMYIDYGSSNNIIGGAVPGAGNVIANAYDGYGIQVDGIFQGLANGNLIRGNSIHSNSGLGIDNFRGGNTELAPPVVTTATNLSAAGTACAICAVDVYSDSADEGRVYEGSATADPGGNWSFSGAVSGPNVTATAVDGANNTSEFSAPFTLPPTPTPSPTPSPTPTLTPTPTPEPTPTPTATTIGQTPTPTPVGQTPTPTPTATPSSTPTPTPGSPTGTGQQLTQGDVDCNGAVTSVDSLKELRFVAQLPVSQTEPCPGIGDNVASFWGDVDCNGAVTSVDALKILRHVASLVVAQTEPCADIGTDEN